MLCLPCLLLPFPENLGFFLRQDAALDLVNSASETAFLVIGLEGESMGSAERE